MTRRRKKPLKAGKSAGRSVPPYPHEFRLKVAKLYVEDGYPAKLIATQFGISDYSVYTWGKKYREHGEQGLVYQPKATTGSKLPEAVSQSIVDLKKENPGYGARRITDILKRFFLVRTSPSTVQRTPHAQGLTQPPKRKRELALMVENAAHALNHHPRRSLSGKNACRTYFRSDRPRFNKRQRSQAWDWIRDMAAQISVKCKRRQIDPAAWRIAARKWMEKHHLIIIHKPAVEIAQYLW